eukprot:scaffold97863_cov18-Prasinocladus_malaysianus.AAC.3
MICSCFGQPSHNGSLRIRILAAEWQSHDDAMDEFALIYEPGCCDDDDTNRRLPIIRPANCPRMNY